MIHLKNYLIILSINLVFVSSAIGEALGNKTVITLEEAVNISLSNNPEIQISKADVDISRANLKSSKSTLYPQIESRIVIPFVEAESGFFLDQLIWDFGRTQNDIRASRYNIESKKADFNFTEQKIIKDTKLAYFEALIAKNNMEIRKTKVKTSELILERTKELFNAGITSNSELSQVQIDLQELKLNYLDEKNSYKIAKLNLSRIMGKEIVSDFDIEDSTNYENVYLRKNELIELATSSNPQIRSVVSRQAGIKSRLKSSKSNFFPRVFGRVAYRFDGEGADEPDFIAGIGIRLPIFQGFSRFAEIDRSNAELNRNQAELNSLKKDIIFSIEELYLQLQNLEEKINITKESKLIAENSLKLVEERFDLKRASKIELAEAQSVNTESLSNYKNAIYNYKIAKIRLENLLGE